MKIGRLTLSDRASKGIYQDLSGPEIERVIREHFDAEALFVVRLLPDERDQIEEALIELSDREECDLVVTTGGTGPAQRDVTPEATCAVLDRVLPGFGETMRAVSFQKTPTAILSRAIAGTRGRTLIINLPGNPRAIAKCLVPIIPAIQECMAHLNLPHNKLPTQRRLTRDRKRLESFMQRQEPLVASSFSDKTHAVAYDQKFVKLAAMRDALPLLISAIFADLPVEARILCVGAGTGHELIYLAQKFPQWHFTAVEPSAPMLEICRQKAEAGGIASRCFFHEGYLDSLPPSAAFDAATSLLVSQFILAPEARTDFFRAIAGRLRPGGFLASADLASDITSANYQSLLDVWIRLMRETGSAPEQLEKMRVAYGRDVSVLPLEQVSSIIAAGGFETPVLFLQTGLIHAWYAKRTPTDA